MLQHTSATATSAKDAYLVSLTGDSKDEGYVVLRRVRARASCRQRGLTHSLYSSSPEQRGRLSKRSRPCLTCVCQVAAVCCLPSPLTAPRVLALQILDRTGLYRPRLVLAFDGYVYNVGDFVLRLGRATTTGRTYGPLLEVEYRPVSSLLLAAQPIAEMFASINRAISSLEGSFFAVDEPRLADYGLSLEEHTNRHNALALVYAVGATMARRDTSAAQPAQAAQAAA